MFLFLSLMLVALVALPARPTSAGNVSERGYLWTLHFDYEQDYNGLLTIKVGPMKNGDLLSVDETSTSVVPCQRIGAVNQAAGAAVFSGGYLRCSFNLAGALLANHGIVADPTDSYNRMTMRARLASTGFNLAPIVSHADVTYQLDFSSPSSVGMRQGLATDAGVVNSSAIFPGLFGGALRNYGMVYGCAIGGGACSARFYAGADTDVMPAAGGPVSFRTGPTSILIGGDGATTFLGGIDDLIIDPGNSFPRPS
jgi:hypothetical protein